MNIGFSKNKQITRGEKRRQKMVYLDEKNEIKSAVKRFGTSDNSVTLPDQNFLNSISNQNRIKSSLTVIKPRNKRSFLAPAPTVSENKNIEIEPVEIMEEVLPEVPVITESNNEITTEKIVPEVVGRQNFETRTIQIGLLNLSEIESFGDLCQKYNLPSWQLTAFDPQTGGAWINYSNEMSPEKQNEFSIVIAKHLASFGILDDKIKFELCYDATNSDSHLGQFHCKLEDNFYSSIEVKSLSKLLRESELFMTRYNYKINFEGPLTLPPNQLICRLYGIESAAEILTFKPTVLDKNKVSRARYLIGLRMMAGMLTSIGRSVRFRRNGIRTAVSAKIANKINAKKAKSSASSIKDNSKAIIPNRTVPSQNKFEFISLKNMNWEKPEARQIKSVAATSKIRNRQELISRAKELLAQKRSITELKNTLPMTEGELTLLSKNITFSDKERN